MLNHRCADNKFTQITFRNFTFFHLSLLFFSKKKPDYLSWLFDADYYWHAYILLGIPHTEICFLSGCEINQTIWIWLFSEQLNGNDLPCMSNNITCHWLKIGFPPHHSPFIEWNKHLQKCGRSTWYTSLSLDWEQAVEWSRDVISVFLLNICVICLPRLIGQLSYS